jgi:3-oxoacyl-(acyl-carrier-protein) synthase
MTGSRLFISEFQTLSALGYLTSGHEQHSIAPRPAEYRWGFPVFPLHEDAERRVESFIGREKTPPDRATLLALAASSKACGSLALTSAETRIGISIGSSRGPTTSIEESYGAFVRQLAECGEVYTRGSRQSGRDREGIDCDACQIETPSQPHPTVPAYTSPRTTAGTLSSSVGQALLQLRSQNGVTEPTAASSEILSLGTSMTCSSAFHSILIGVGMLRSRLVDKWVFGGSEAPLTPYTLAQMDALGIYTHYSLDAPCRPGVLSCWKHDTDQRIKSSFTLGEGSGVGVLSLEGTPPENATFEIVGIGWGMERTPSPSGISGDGEAFYAAMESALSGIEKSSILGVVAHAPGTLKGDRAEIAAIDRTFGQHKPVRLSSKHMTGHTFGASGMLSLEIVRAIASGKSLPGLPPCGRGVEPTKWRFLINSGGFGGNSISIVVDWLR